MHHIDKNAIVPYSCQQMYQLVNQIDAYPQFLNWCSDSSILKQTNTQIIASIKINKGVFNQSFTTVNTLTLNERIIMQLQNGPFNHLHGVWLFTHLNDNACKVALTLEFNFTTKIVDKAISPIFTTIANTQLDAFIARAKKIYG